MDDDLYGRSAEHSLRRASEPFGGLTDNNQARISSQLTARVPLPLPYLPSDYEPSSTSPSHRILFPENLDFARQVPYPTMTRQRSRSVGPRDTSPRRSVLAIESSQSSENHNYELVPYREWTVISRNDNNGQVVLYNPESRMITVRHRLPDGSSPTGSPASVQNSLQFSNGECPFCHRPFPRSHAEDMDEPNYMDRNYFRLLASSPIHSPAASHHGTPRTTRQNATEPSFSMDESIPSASASHIRLNANAFNQGYYKKFFVEKKKLGRGFRGSVFLCEHELDGVKLGKYAVKKVAIGNNHSWLVKMLREVHLLERLRHPNIVSYKHAWLEYHRPTPFGPEIPCLFILMECANGGNLEEYMEPEIVAPTAPSPEENSKDRNLAKKKKRERIRRQLQEQGGGAGGQQTDAEHPPAPIIHTQKRLLSIPEIRSFFLDIVEGLAHLHQQSIVHRDLKPPNLLLKWDNRNHNVSDAEHMNFPRVLISDFGECEDLEDVPDRERTGATGTLEFMAPEHVRLLAGEKHMREYSPKADMWSLGIVLYYLCYTTLPYSNVDDVDLLRKEILDLTSIEFPESRFDIYNGLEKKMDPTIVEAMRRQNVPSDIPQEYKMLIRMLLSRDPEKRPSCEKILSQVRQMRPSAPKYRAMDNNTLSATASKWSEPVGGTSLGNGNHNRNNHGKNGSGSSSNGSSLYEYALESRQQRPSWQQIEPISEPGLKIQTLPPPVPMDIDEDQSKTISPFDSPETISATMDATSGRRKSVKREHLVDAQAIENSGVKRRKRQQSSLSASPEQQDEPWLLEPVYQSASYSSNVIKMATVVIKVASTAYHCYPYLPRGIVLYPILLLALLDFRSDRLSHSLLLVFLHVVWILLVALSTGSVCVLPA